MTASDPVGVFRAGLLSGHVALVTGGASGIGRACALGLARVGATVAVLDLNETGCTEVVRDIAALSPASRAYVADLTDAEQLDDFVDTVTEDLGPVRILVNAAADLSQGAVLNSTVAEWEASLRVNVLAPFALVRAVGRRMHARGEGGSIVNIGSSSAYRALGTGGRYGVSKSAIAALTRAAAGELGQAGIRVNTVAPGLTRTPAAARHFPDEAALSAAMTSGPMANLLGTVTEAEDIAAAVVFLCLPAARQITAQVIHVSAGLVSG